ncbi:MAG: DUF4105 domain-containing protein [Bacteroidota bacterium]
MKRVLVMLSVLLFAVVSCAQSLPTLSNKAQISVMTCAAGDVLYYAFGHSAFRVQDPKLGLDIVYNYGTFNFDKPNFYLNFAKGKLVYSLSRRSFERFLFEYEYEKRWVKEQIFDLTPEETNQFFRFFVKNYLPENRDYLYDPLFNNCSNITANLLKEQFGEEIVFHGDHLPKQYTFRQLVRQFLPINSWGSFGIELAFGGITDRTATVEEHMFLPYYAMEQLQNTTKAGEPLLRRERDILDYPELKNQSTFMTSPLFWFIVLLLFVLVLTYLDFKHGTYHPWLDFPLFLLSGLAGIAILLLWLGTDHQVTIKNLNFLWLLPTNTVVAFLLFHFERFQWLSYYFWFALIGIGLIVLLWILRVQVLSPLNIPLLLLLGVRYLFLLKHPSNKLI